MGVALNKEWHLKDWAFQMSVRASRITLIEYALILIAIGVILSMALVQSRLARENGLFREALAQTLAKNDLALKEIKRLEGQLSCAVAREGRHMTNIASLEKRIGVLAATPVQKVIYAPGVQVAKEN